MVVDCLFVCVCVCVICPSKIWKKMRTQQQQPIKDKIEKKIDIDLYCLHSKHSSICLFEFIYVDALALMMMIKYHKLSYNMIIIIVVMSKTKTKKWKKCLHLVQAMNEWINVQSKNRNKFNRANGQATWWWWYLHWNNAEGRKK